MELEGRVALVTGASRGIGKAIALKLASMAARVVINDVNEAGAREVSEIIRAGGGEALAVKADVSDRLQVEAMVEAVANSFGKIDILVNNAGITRDTLLLRMSEQDWDAVLSTNLRGVYLCTRACLRFMLRQRWGRVISISSVAGLVGNAGQTNYAAAKAGIIGFTKSLAKEVGSRSITVNAVAPGFIATDMTRALPKERQEQILGVVSLGRFGTVEDVAEAIAFLASERASYITGAVISVDGGVGL